MSVAAATIEQVFREESGQAIATLVRLFGDIDVAEEAVQEAFLIASERWPQTGVPPNPAGWIVTTAKNRAIDRFRREASRHDRQVQALDLTAVDPDEEDGAMPVAHAGRPAWPHLHVLPPRARAERPGGADAPPARRPPDPRDRARVPRSRADDGATPRAREEEDQRRQHPVPHPPRRGADRPAPPRARGRVPGLQRGPHGERRRAARRATTSAARLSAWPGCSPS